MYSILALASVTRFGKLPEELLHHIISFNEIEAVEIIQKKAKNMLKNKIKAFESMFISGFDTMGKISLNKYKLFYNNRIVSKEEVVETFSNCECCERHKINRPKSLQPWINTPFQNCGEIDYPCKCNCRHVSRFICRAFRPR